MYDLNANLLLSEICVLTVCVYVLVFLYCFTEVIYV